MYLVINCIGSYTVYDIKIDSIIAIRDKYINLLETECEYYASIRTYTQIY